MLFKIIHGHVVCLSAMARQFAKQVSCLHNQNHNRCPWKKFDKFKRIHKHNRFVHIPPAEHLLESWFYEVKTFGKLTINTPFDIVLQPLNPQTYPKMDRFLLKTLYQGSRTPDASSLSALSKLYQFQLNVNEDKNDVCLTGSYSTESSLPLLFYIQMPMKFDIEATSQDTGNINLEGFENDSTCIKIKDGNIHSKNVKSGEIILSSENGNITCENLLQGNLKLTSTGSGSIQTGKLQGQTVKCHTDGGTISISDMYAGNSDVQSQTGDIRLGNCHGNTTVKSGTGSLTIDSLDGNLTGDIKQGSASVYIARAGSVCLNCHKGDVTLRLPDVADSSISTSSRELDVDPEVKLTRCEQNQESDQVVLTGSLSAEGTEGSISVTAKKGKITLQKESWLSSLNLGFAQMD